MHQKNLLLIFYEPVEYIYTFIKFADSNLVDYFPLFKYAHDINEKRSDYYDMLKKKISSFQPDNLIWFFIDMPTCMRIKQDFSVKNVAFLHNDIISPNLINICKEFDRIYTNDIFNFDRYKILLDNTKIVPYITPYDGVIYSKLDLTKSKKIVIYISSMIYFVNTDDFIKIITLQGFDNGYDVELHGPDELETLFPNIYMSNPDEIEFAMILKNAAICVYLDNPASLKFANTIAKIIATKTKIITQYPIHINLPFFDMEFIAHTEMFSHKGNNNIDLVMRWEDFIEDFYNNLSQKEVF